MKYLKRVELNPQRNVLTVRGITTSQQPYEIEILSSRGARLWNRALNSLQLRRRSMGGYKIHSKVSPDVIDRSLS